MQSLESIKAIGLVYRFLGEADLAYGRLVTSQAEQFMKSNDGGGEKLSLDSLSAELFLKVASVYLCGIFLSLVGATGV